MPTRFVASWGSSFTRSSFSSSDSENRRSFAALRATQHGRLVGGSHVVDSDQARLVAEID
ncbi:MAG: hypothetical protein WCB92_10160 [Mycobacterium sp.]